MSASTPLSDDFFNPDMGREIHDFARQPWPINRSITGAGVRETLAMIKAHVPTLVTRDIATGTQVFDWTIPQEWFVREAWIKTPDGRRICDFSENNLHLVGYSAAVNKTISKEELENHLYSRPDLPDAIPYVTSYYKPRWGFCISDTQRQQLPDGDYHVFVDADHFDGSLTYGEAFFEGETDDEILISTYVCHPSMANNEISGMAVSTFLARHVANMPSRRFSYRFVFVPETIGSIAFLSQNLNALKAKVKAGFNLTCIGDDRSYSFLPSREGNTISDRVARHVLGLGPELRDMRPFLWHNYGEDGDKFILDLRYTSLVRLEKAGVSIDFDKNNVYKCSSKSRRQEIRYGVKAGVTTRSIDQIDDFMHFYEMTFARQGISLDREEHETVRRICTALQSKNMMNMYGTYTAEDDLASIFVFARDSKRAYYLFGANHPDFRDATAVHWAFSIS